MSTHTTPREARLARLDAMLERLDVICADAAEHPDDEPPGLRDELAAMTAELRQMLDEG